MNMSWLRRVRVTVGKSRLEAAGVTLFLFLALLVFFWPAVFKGRVLLPADLAFELDPLWRPLAPEGFDGPSNSLLGDQAHQFYPWDVFTRRWIMRGQLPLWNPYTDAGAPFVGNAQSAVFSPFNLLGYLFPLNASLVITAILRLFVAGIFTFLFAREIGIRVTGALVALVTFTFSGPMVVWLGHPHSRVIVWLPGILFATERALTRRETRYTALGGLLIGAQLLGGHPETSFHLMLAWAVYVLYRTASLKGRRPSRWLPPLARMGAMASSGALIGSIQLLPFAGALLNSATLTTRAAEASETGLSIGKLLLDWHEWPTIITTLMPQYFGTSLDDSYWFPYSNYVEQNAYVGVLPLALAIMVVLRNVCPPFSSKRNWILFFGSMAVTCLGVALHFPGLNAINALPPLSVMANGRLRLIYAFAMAILAGLGLDAISVEIRSHQLSVLRVLVVLGFGAAILSGATYAGFIFFRDEVIQSGRAFMEANWSDTPYFSRPLEHYYDLVEERYREKLALFRPDNVKMYTPVLIAIAWIGIHKLKRDSRAKAEVWRSAALGLIILDLFVTGLPFNPTVAPGDIFPTPKAVKIVRQDKSIYRVSGTGLTLYPNSGMLFGLQDIRGYETVVPQRYVDLVDQLDGHYRFHFHSLFTEATSRLWDLLNVKYVFTDQKPGEKWQLVYEGAQGVNLFRNTDVLPRAFVVHDVRIVKGPAQSLRRVLAPSFDFREEVVLERNPSQDVKSLEGDVPSACVRVVDYRPNRVIVNVETHADGMLVVTDNYAPGWEALLDGRPASVYVANHAFRAVFVPVGTHQVEFVYRPLSFYAGAALSLLGLVAIGALFFRAKPGRSSSRHL